jgi:gamma-glutamyl:cysteine ligase YbdK (ATP-grasp superfamily)
VVGIEIEYMIVDKQTLQIKPIADKIIYELTHHFSKEVRVKDVAMSHEFVLHVLELKHHGVALPTDLKERNFCEMIQQINAQLSQYDAILMPTSMHPMMDPVNETVRWPHDNKVIYDTYDAIFNAKTHGFSNVQSMHLNFPYQTPEEFNQLHEVLRLLLPIIPALTASSPMVEGVLSTMSDMRLYYYEQNQSKVPLITGAIIPDSVTYDLYEDAILRPMYHAIEPFDNDRILQHPWLNSRGVIPKFEQQALEVRLFDTQECVKGDLLIAKWFYALAQWLYDSYDGIRMPSLTTGRLKRLLNHAMMKGREAEIDDMNYLQLLGFPEQGMTFGFLLSDLTEKLAGYLSKDDRDDFQDWLTLNTLSYRIKQALHYHSTHDIYASLIDNLASNTFFRGVK